jgi:hypothetical protein
MMKKIPNLPNDIIELIKSKLPQKTKNELQMLSNKSNEGKYFNYKSQSAKNRFFQKQNETVQKNIRQEEFDQWKTVTLNNNKLMKEGGLIIKKLLKGLITNEISVNNSNEFDITRVSSLDYAMLTFKMDEGLQDLIKKYNKVFQEFVSLYKFKLFIYKYLDMKYSPYLIEYYRIVPKYLDDIVRDIIRELKR